MILNFMVLCIAVGVTGVFGGCVKDRFLIHEHFPAKEVLLKDVDFIDGELKLKLDHKIEEKELLDKTLVALKSYFLKEHETLGKEEVYAAEKVYVPVVDPHEEGKHEVAMKILKSMLGSDYEVDKLTGKDLDGELKLKQDHKIEEKELLDKTLAALKSYFLKEHETLGKEEAYAAEKVYVPVVDPHEEDKHEVSMKILKSMLGSDYKVEELTEKELASLEIILKCLFERIKGKESMDKVFKSKIEDSSVMHSAKMSEYLPEESKDVKTYLAESILHSDISKDADIHHGIEDRDILHKKFEKSGGEIPYFLMDDEAKEYFKSLVEGKIGEEEILHSLAGGDEEAYKKLSKILKDGLSHEEGSAVYLSKLAKEAGIEKSTEAAKTILEHKDFQKEAVLNHGKDHVYDEILKKEEIHSLDKGFEEDKLIGVGKVFEGHEAFHKEKALDHAKDHIYDDILKKEEIHSLDKDFEEDKFHGAAKSFEDHLIEKGILASGEKVFGFGETVEGLKAKAKEYGVKKLTKDEEIAKAGKDISIEDILKEDGYYMTGGTHAYEAARDKAHVDATIPLIEDHEITVDSSIGHGEKVFHKASEGAEFSKGKEVLHGVMGKEGILKEKAHGTDIGIEEAHGIGESHIKHGIKTEESHLIHGIPKEHHVETGFKIDETLSKEIPHSKAHEIKQKLLGILRKVVPIPKCHLVTMPPPELLGIVNCISRSKDPLLCEKFAMCEKKKPLQVILALEKCQKEIIPDGVKQCSKHEPLYPSPEIPVKIFKCIVKNIHELTPPEKKMMIEFETCARQVKVESCGRFPWG